MRTTITCIVCVVVSSLLACADASAQIAATDVDFGHVTEAMLTKGKKTVVLKNESDHAVVLDKVTAGCGCVQITWVAPQTIEAGQSVETVAKLRASEIHVGAFAYPIVAEVDGVQQKLGEVRYDYEPLVDPNQRSLWMESVDGLRALDGHFGMMTSGDTQLADVSVIVPDYIKVAVERQTGRSAKVTLSYRGEQPLREREFDVLLKVSGSEDEPFRLAVHVPALDLVTLDPGAVLMPNLKAGKSATRSVRVRPLTDQPIKADALEVVSEDAQVSGVIREADGEIWVDVAVRPERAGVDSTTLILRDRSQSWSVPINTTWRSDD